MTDTFSFHRILLWFTVVFFAKSLVYESFLELIYSGNYPSADISKNQWNVSKETVCLSYDTNSLIQFTWSEQHFYIGNTISTVVMKDHRYLIEFDVQNNLIPSLTQKYFPTNYGCALVCHSCLSRKIILCYLVSRKMPQKSSVKPLQRSAVNKFLSISKVFV